MKWPESPLRVSELGEGRGNFGGGAVEEGEEDLKLVSKGPVGF